MTTPPSADLEVGHGLVGVSASPTSRSAEEAGPGGLTGRLLGSGPAPLPAVPGAEVRAIVARAGLVGRGGGGFPTARKMAAVAGHRRRPVLVANGAEGEPLSRKDELLLATAPHLVLAGIVLAARAVGAPEAYLCLHRGSPALPAVRSALARGSSGSTGCGCELRETPRRYVASEESALVRWLSGGPAVPTSRPPLPTERGVRGAPTLILNVETLAAVALAVRLGPDALPCRRGPGRARHAAGDRGRGGPVPGGVRGADRHRRRRRAGARRRRAGLGRRGAQRRLRRWLARRGAGLVDAVDVRGAAVGAAPPSAPACSPCCRAAPAGWPRRPGSCATWPASPPGQCGPCVFGLPAIAGALEAVLRADRHARGGGRRGPPLGGLGRRPRRLPAPGRRRPAGRHRPARLRRRRDPARPRRRLPGRGGRPGPRRAGSVH